ncbi:MAG: hypothetical protein SNJ74_04315 [Fimbriimonadaceae bacterium]
MTQDTAIIETANDPGSGKGVETPLRWEVRLFAAAPKKRIAVFAVAWAAGAFGILAFDNVVLGLLGVGAILGSTTEFWLPLRYTVDSEGARVRCGLVETALTWDRVKRAVLADDGVKLSPLAKASRMGAFRGVYLRFADNRDDVLAAIGRHWGGDVRPLEG